MPEPGRDGADADFVAWTDARGSGLLRVAYLLHGTRARAQAAVDEALSRSMAHWSGPVGGEQPDRLALRRLVTARRPGWDRIRRGGTPAPEPLPSPPLDQEPGAGDRDRVWRACHRLPQDQRAALVLRHHEGLGAADIGDLTGRREPTVRAVLARGLSRVRALAAPEASEHEVEGLLREALAEAARAAPAPADLVARAQALSRARRRRRAVVAGAGALVVGTVAVVGPLTGKDPDHQEGPAAGRTESWHDVQVSVPREWGWGSLGTWCASARGSVPPPVVERPGAGTRTITCEEPAVSYGVRFFDPDAAGRDPVDLVERTGAVTQYEWGRGRAARVYPNGAWLGVAVLGDVGVLVVGRDETTAREVLGSARVIPDADDNGCAARLAQARAKGSAVMSVCRYGADGWLLQSEALTEGDSVRARESLTSAPPADPSAGCQGRPEPTGGDEVVVMSLGTTLFRIEWGDPCPPGSAGGSGRGVLVGDERRDLTAEVMYWALSPGWSGVVDGSVPLPDELRR